MNCLPLSEYIVVFLKSSWEIDMSNEWPFELKYFILVNDVTSTTM